MSDRPYISFAEVKAKVPLPEVLEHFDLTEHFHRHGDTYTGVCPLPQHKHGPKPNDQQFKINKLQGIYLWHCFGDCNRGGDVIEFVKAMTGYSDAHVRLWFAEHYGDRLTLTKPKEDVQVDEPAAQPAPAETDDDAPLKTLRFYLNLNADAARPYLDKREVNPAIAQRYGLGLCEKGMLSGYLAMPLYRWPKEKPTEYPVGYLGRWPGDDFDDSAGRPRYKLPEGLPVSRLVYGLEQALAVDCSYLIVVEGPFKVFHLVAAGYPATVSTLTANVSAEQAGILAQTGRQIIMLFDGDEAGRAGTRRAAGHLITQAYVRAIRLPDDAEPDTIPLDQLRDLLAFCSKPKPSP